jgi:uncharacterized protein (TIGR02145 family)
MPKTFLSISIIFTLFSCDEPKTVVSKTGRIWMDRNLGAEQVASSPNDEKSFGDLYQWGRSADGHQLRNSLSKIGQLSSDSISNVFFMRPINTLSENWSNTQNVNLWQGQDGMANINCPCPKGFRIPTAKEWTQEVNSWSSNDFDGAFKSPLKLPLGGYRYSLGGNLTEVGEKGNYWSSSYYGEKSGGLEISCPSPSQQYYSRIYKLSWARVLIKPRAHGFSVRCIKEIQN